MLFGDSMRKRIISGAIMCAIFIPLLIIGGLPFRIALGIIAILAYKEIIDIKGIKNYPKPVIATGLFVLLLLAFSNRDIVYSNLGLNYKYLMFSFLALFLPTIFYFEKDKYNIKDAFCLTSFVMFLGIVLNLASNILIYNKPYFIMLLLITVLTDVFAYFTGVMIGKHKFTKISPNKTIEGCVGGVIMGTVITSIYYMTFIGIEPISKVMLVLLILSITCEVGDLFYSALKREVGIKDFSNLIPGHGGVLDRIDSLTFVIAMYVLLAGII